MSRNSNSSNKLRTNKFNDLNNKLQNINLNLTLNKINIHVKRFIQ